MSVSPNAIKDPEVRRQIIQLGMAINKKNSVPSSFTSVLDIEIRRILTHISMAIKNGDNRMVPAPNQVQDLETRRVLQDLIKQIR